MFPTVLFFSSIVLTLPPFHPKCVFPQMHHFLFFHKAIYKTLIKKFYIHYLVPFWTMVHT